MTQSGKLIVQACKRAKLSQAELARKVFGRAGPSGGVMLCQVKSGERPMSLRIALGLARTRSVKLADLSRAMAASYERTIYETLRKKLAQGSASGRKRRGVSRRRQARRRRAS